MPRHPQRGAEIAELAPFAGLARWRCARDGEPERATELYVADTIGELGLFYRLAPIVFMGGSLVPHGGQNPIEPAKLGARDPARPARPRISPTSTRRSTRAGGALLVADGQTDLARAEQLSDQAALTRDMARAAARRGRGARRGARAARLQAIEPYHRCR